MDFPIPQQSLKVSHGNWSGNSQLYHPGPQTNSSCSNVQEIIFSNFSSGPSDVIKANYCLPNNFATSYSLMDLNDTASDLSFYIAEIDADFQQRVDNGRTAHLLGLISDSGFGNSGLRDSLLNPDFLSDTVMVQYFRRSGVPHAQLKEIFAKNSPVKPYVYGVLLNVPLNYADSVFCDSLQGEYKFSDRHALWNKRAYYVNGFHFLQQEKIRRFLKDTTGPLWDSIAAIYKKRLLPDHFYRLAEVYISGGAYAEASTYIDSLEETSSDAVHRVRLLRHARDVFSTAGYLDALRADGEEVDYIRALADANHSGHSGMAKALMYMLNEDYREETILVPDTSSQARHAATTGIEEQLLFLQRNFQIFPNPANDRLHVVVPGPGYLLIRDVSGRLIFSTSCAGQCDVAVDSWPEGLYFVSLFMPGQEPLHQKVIVQR